MLETFIEILLTYIIPLLELMGIFVVTWSALCAFWVYLKVNVMHHGVSDTLKADLANGLATALEFKMAAEILKTVIVREQSELVVLGAVIVLRALLSFLIHFELQAEEKQREHAERRAAVQSAKNDHTNDNQR